MTDVTTLLEGLTADQLREVAADAQRRLQEMETAGTPQTRRITLRRKDLNAKGNGTQETRRLRLPGGESGWASDLAQDVSGSWESGSYRASQRKCKETGEVPVGTLVLAFDSTLRGGSKSGRADVTAGVVVSEDEDADDPIRWGLSTRRRGKTTEVQDPATGEWTEI